MLNSESKLEAKSSRNGIVRYDSAIYTHNSRNFENKKVISSPILRETGIVGTVVASGDAQEKPT